MILKKDKEYTDEELGELLLQSVQEMIEGKIGRIHHVKLNKTDKTKKKNDSSSK